MSLGRLCPVSMSWPVSSATQAPARIFPSASYAGPRTVGDQVEQVGRVVGQGEPDRIGHATGVQIVHNVAGGPRPRRCGPALSVRPVQAFGTVAAATLSRITTRWSAAVFLELAASEPSATPIFLGQDRSGAFSCPDQSAIRPGEQGGPASVDQMDLRQPRARSGPGPFPRPPRARALTQPLR